jgi:hypothetical protein
VDFIYFLFFYFDLPRRAPNHLGKYVICCDDRSEAVVVARLGKSFLTASEKIYVVVVTNVVHVYRHQILIEQQP